MPKPKTVTVNRGKPVNKVTYVTVYLRVCDSNIHSNLIDFDSNIFYGNEDCCCIIPYKLKIPREAKK